MKKRLWMVVLALVVLIGALTLTASAATEVDHGTCGYGLTWWLYSNGKLAIRGSGMMEDGSSPWRYYSDDITEVDIDNGVANIGELAFSGCSNLTSVKMPQSVTSIGWSAFENCTGLTTVTLIGNVGNVSSRAFAGCTALTTLHLGGHVTEVSSNLLEIYSLTSITVDDWSSTYSSKDGILLSEDGKTVIHCPRGKTGSLAIPTGVTSIGNSAFSDCSGLTLISIPASVTNIGESAFSGCIGLTSVEIPNSVTNIGESAFSGCIGLTSVEIPNSVTNIESYTFSGCTGLTSVTIPNSVTTIGEYAFFDCTGLTSVTIPNSVTNIESYTFSGCTGLTSVEIPNSVTNIESYTFSGCTGLTSVTIPNSVTSIGYSAFRDCTGLMSVEIPDSVTSIGSGAFSDCSSLTSMSIPTSVTAIGSSAFSGCSSLTSMSIPTSVTAIEDATFRSCTALTTVSIPSSVTSIGRSAFSGCTALTSVTIPCGVTSIEDWTFYGCSNLTSVSIPSSVTTIGSDAFRDCDELIAVVIPHGATSIGDYAFYSCSSLTTVFIPESMKILHNEAFAHTALTDIYYGGTLDQWMELVPPDGLLSYIPNGVVVHRNSAGPVDINVQPEDQQAADGYVYFAVKAKGDGLTYKWQVRAANGKTWSSTSLKGYNTNTLRVPVNDNNNGRHYRCVITDRYGNVVNSGEATLTMINPVTIVTQPRSVAVKNGETAQVTVKATGDGLTYKWYYKNATAADFSYTSSFTKNSYSVKMNSTRNGRQVYCIISDKYGNEVQTDIVTLTMQSPLKIVTQPEDQVVPDGYAYFKVKAEGEGLTYQWQVRMPTGKAWSKTSLKGYNTDTLRVPSNATSNGRHYRCVITDQYGNVVTSGEATLIVVNPVTIVTQPKSVVVKNGETAKVTVKATGDGLTYKWYYKNAGASKFSYTSSFSGSSYSVQMNSTRSGRQVYCVITDKYGNSVTTNTVTLTMGNTVKIVAQPEDQTVFETYAYFKVKAEGDGLTYQWQVRAANGTKWSNTSLKGYNTNTLRVPANTTNDGRHYRCVITDKYGNVATSGEATLTLITVIGSGTCGSNLNWVLGSDGVLTVSGTGEMDDYDNMSGRYPSPWYKYREVVNQVVLEQGVTSIGRDAFSDFISLTSVDIPDGMLSISDGAFEDCFMLASIDLPDSLIGLGAAFKGCSSLTEITIPQQVEELTAYIFHSCSSLETVTLPEGLKTIMLGAFFWCHSLDDLVIPSTVTTIGSHAFLGCDNLTSVTFTGAAPSIASDAFRDVFGTVCYYPCNEPTWDEYVMQNYEGGLSWEMYHTTEDYACTRCGAKFAHIVTQPTDVTVAKGKTAKVMVQATGDGLTYQWYYKNAGASKFSLTDSFKGNSYSVSMSAARNGRQVYCVITDKYGNSVTTNTVTLKMK